MRIVTDENQRLGQWLLDRQGVGGCWRDSDGQTIGLTDDAGEIKAVAMYDNFNHANVHVHIAAVPGSHWMTRDFLWYIFYYPFEQLRCKRITGFVASTNTAAQRLDEHLGFKLEATLKDAHPLGDLLIYSMTKDECKWLTRKRKTYGRV